MINTWIIYVESIFMREKKLRRTFSVIFFSLISRLYHYLIPYLYSRVSSKQTERTE